MASRKKSISMSKKIFLYDQNEIKDFYTVLMKTYIFQEEESSHFLMFLTIFYLFRKFNLEQRVKQFLSNLVLEILTTVQQ